MASFMQGIGTFLIGGRLIACCMIFHLKIRWVMNQMKYNLCLEIDLDSNMLTIHDSSIQFVKQRSELYVLNEK